MLFDAESDFEHRDFEPRWFVASVLNGSFSYGRGNRHQIQFLNEDGQGAAVLDFRPEDADQLLRLVSLDLPQPIIEAARRGESDYFDADGCRRDPISLNRT